MYVSCNFMLGLVDHMRCLIYGCRDMYAVSFLFCQVTCFWSDRAPSLFRPTTVSQVWGCHRIPSPPSKKYRWLTYFACEYQQSTFVLFFQQCLAYSLHVGAVNVWLFLNVRGWTQGFSRPETMRSYLQPHKISESEVRDFLFFKCKSRLGDGDCKSLVATWPVMVFKPGNPRESSECSNYPQDRQCMYNVTLRRVT
jgi:hypothetical protein